jgi:putative ABC transport system substrate-binding protein
MRRRDVITLLGGATVAWPLAGRTQSLDRMRRVGIVMPYPKGDAVYESRARALRQEIAKLGWTEGACEPRQQV